MPDRAARADVDRRLRTAAEQQQQDAGLVGRQLVEDPAVRRMRPASSLHTSRDRREQLLATLAQAELVLVIGSAALVGRASSTRARPPASQAVPAAAARHADDGLARRRDRPASPRRRPRPPPARARPLRPGRSWRAPGCEPSGCRTPEPTTPSAARPWPRSGPCPGRASAAPSHTAGVRATGPSTSLTSLPPRRWPGGAARRRSP